MVRFVSGPCLARILALSFLTSGVEGRVKIRTRFEALNRQGLDKHRDPAMSMRSPQQAEVVELIVVVVVVTVDGVAVARHFDASVTRRARDHHYGRQGLGARPSRSDDL